MKKLLTILALAALLCMLCSVALADQTYKNVYYSVAGTTSQYDFGTHGAGVPLPQADDAMIIGGKTRVIASVAPAWDTLSGHNTSHAVTIQYYEDVEDPTATPLVGAGRILSVQVTLITDPHDYTVTTGVKKDSTCTVKGYDEKKCYGCDQKTNVERKLADHQFVEKLSSSDCTKGGKTQMVCTVCGAVEDGTTHTWGPTTHTFDASKRQCIVVDVVPSCYDGSKGAVANGTYHLVCAVCGQPESAYKFYEMDPGMYAWYTQDWDFDGHNWDEWVWFDPDCKLPARQVRWCLTCHVNETEYMDAMNATAAPVFTAANITSSKGSINCGTVIGDLTAVCKNCNGTAANHKITGGTAVTWTGKYESHTYQMAVDTAKFTISITEDGDKIASKGMPHVYSFANETRVKQNAAGTSYEVAATCTEGAYVEYVCSNEFKGNNSIVNYGATRNHPTTKKYNEDKPAKDHAWGPWEEIVAPNAQKNIEGYWVRHCTTCGLEQDKHGTEIPCTAAAHTWVLKETKAATKEADGTNTYECSTCKATKTETIKYTPSATAKYEVKDAVYDGMAVTGKVAHVADTKDLANVFARVTFFYADGTFAVMVVPVEDGEFYAGATTATVHVAVQIVDNAKQITPPAEKDIYGNAPATMK